MRLIDAEAMLQDVQEQISLIKTLFPDEEINDISIMLGATIKNQIDKMPTIEAIPIERIKRWAMKSENTYNREQIFEMLNDWEKENGREGI